MLEIILSAFYLLLPAYAANMAPVVFRKTPFLDNPIDFGKRFGKTRIFGSHKTYRGLFFGVLSAVGITGIQNIFSFGKSFAVLDYSGWLMIGILLGFGAILGDAVESFFKRRVGIKPGRPWIPFDQVDFIIGALVMISFMVHLGWELIVTGIVLSFFLHVFINQIAFLVRIRKERW